VVREVRVLEGTDGELRRGVRRQPLKLLNAGSMSGRGPPAMPCVLYELNGFGHGLEGTMPNPAQGPGLEEFEKDG